MRLADRYRGAEHRHRPAAPKQRQARARPIGPMGRWADADADADAPIADADADADGRCRCRCRCRMPMPMPMPMPMRRCRCRCRCADAPMRRCADAPMRRCADAPMAESRTAENKTAEEDGRKRRRPTLASGPSKPRQRPTLPQGCPCSTIGPGELNFRVRDGNGCDLSGIAARKKTRRSAKPGWHGVQRVRMSALVSRLIVLHRRVPIDINKRL